MVGHLLEGYIKPRKIFCLEEPPHPPFGFDIKRGPLLIHNNHDVQYEWLRRGRKSIHVIYKRFIASEPNVEFNHPYLISS